ncbi:MAG: DUF4375 domain-containing protein, partial [Planctomycetaceae bacterium]
DLNDGGLEYYLFNREGEHAVETVAALNTLELTASADLLQQACDLFPESKPSHDIDERHRQLDQLSVEQKQQLNDRGKAILVEFETAAENVQKYLEKHPVDELSDTSSSDVSTDSEESSTEPEAATP